MYKQILRAWDLIVMASHGRRGLMQLLLDSQARNVAKPPQNS
jgi:nucleotide-binding universal stress UspA family protein